jgi:hypothetical protein
VNHPKEQRCGNCLYWNRDDDGPEGECRRRAPLPTVEDAPDGFVKAWWPDTLSSEWCGEWAPAAVPQVYGTPKGG